MELRYVLIGHSCGCNYYTCSLPSKCLCACVSLCVCLYVHMCLCVCRVGLPELVLQANNGIHHASVQLNKGLRLRSLLLSAIHPPAWLKFSELFARHPLAELGGIRVEGIGLAFSSMCVCVCVCVCVC